MLERVQEVIKAFTGYEVKEEEKGFLQYLYESVERHIKNECNVVAVPEGLQAVHGEMTAGRFLQVQKAAVLGSDALEVAKSIRMGDTTVEFAGSTPEARYDALVAALTKERDFSCYRKFRW